MRKYILSPNAQKSLKQIKLYSQKKFGKQQTRLYLTALKDNLDRIAEDPLMGTQRSDIKEGYYSVIFGSHVIFYRIKKNQVNVIDVLHQSMDTLKHL